MKHHSRRRPTRRTAASDVASHWQWSLQSTDLAQQLPRWLDGLCWIWTGPNGKLYGKLSYLMCIW